MSVGLKSQARNFTDRFKLSECKVTIQKHRRHTYPELLIQTGRGVNGYTSRISIPLAVLLPWAAAERK
jgi:hypothetical protein